MLTLIIEREDIVLTLIIERVYSKHCDNYKMLTLIIEHASGSNATIEITDMPKYEKEAEVVEEVRYQNVEAFEVISGDKATELEARMDIDVDPYHEYLRLYLDNGEQATFRNSHAILFAI